MVLLEKIVNVIMIINVAVSVIASQGFWEVVSYSERQEVFTLYESQNFIRSGDCL
jgi:hypothetical protein